MTRSGPQSRIGVVARFLLAGAILCVARAATAAATDRPATSVGDLRNHFVSCFRPPGLAANTRVTFYFSLNNRGGVIGEPRTTLLGFTGPAPERATRLGQFTEAFDRCLPVSLDQEMAATIPGEVYYLQYVVGPDGHEQQVLLRPFGSHGLAPRIGIVGAAVGPARGLPAGPSIRPATAFRPHPGEGPFFHPPIVLPFGRLRDR